MTDTLTAAREGWALDHNGYIAPLRLLPHAVAQSFAVAAE